MKRLVLSALFSLVIFSAGAQPAQVMPPEERIGRTIGALIIEQAGNAAQIETLNLRIQALLEEIRGLKEVAKPQEKKEN